MTTRVMGIVTNAKDAKTWIREQTLKQGKGTASDPLPRRYSADPVDAAFYQAERSLRIRMQTDPQWTGQEPWFVSIEHVQVYVDLALTRVPQWRAGPVLVRDTRREAAHYLSAIYMPARDRRWMRGLIALHELAHHLTPGTRRGGSYHDEVFGRAFLDLLTAMFSPALAETFRSDLAAQR